MRRTQTARDRNDFWRLRPICNRRVQNSPWNNCYTFKSSDLCQILKSQKNQTLRRVCHDQSNPCAKIFNTLRCILQLKSDIYKSTANNKHTFHEIGKFTQNIYMLSRAKIDRIKMIRKLIIKTNKINLFLFIFSIKIFIRDGRVPINANLGCMLRRCARYCYWKYRFIEAFEGPEGSLFSFSIPVQNVSEYCIVRVASGSEWRVSLVDRLAKCCRVKKNREIVYARERAQCICRCAYACVS